MKFEFQHSVFLAARLRTALRLAAGLGLMTAVAACSTAELAVDLAKKYKKTSDEEEAASASVTADPHYKIGTPYQIEGIWYYPERDLSYDRTGIASWYGDQFAGKLTANGEIFQPDIVSAAHKTLPMPSVVRVTNLDNGKSLVVRVNDRGPYVSGRIIDLSREAARLLGFKDNGLARVRVKLLVEQTLRLEELAKRGEFPLLAEDSGPLPEVTPAEKPSVSLSARTTNADSERKKAGGSALDLLSDARSGAVIQTEPQKTEIWIQVGAFHSRDNADNLLSSLGTIGAGGVFETTREGRILYRTRLGPLESVEEADRMLKQVYKRGFSGAEIVVD